MPAADVRAILMNKQENAIKEATYYHAGSQIDLAKVDNSISSWIKAAANGLLNVATRPYVWESKNVLMLVSALENVLILGFVILCLYTTSLKKGEYLNEMLLLLNVCVLYFALIGMSTPVIGNLVRYKAPLLPLLMAAFMLPATWPDKYLTKLQQLIRA